MTRIYRYILVDDVGIAPCPADGLITLATCKPSIRRTAKPGDWVLGFRPGSLERGLLLWGGRVASVLPHGDYERRHRGRPDAVYRRDDDGQFERLDPTYHPTAEQITRDLSGPVLIFDREMSRYMNGKPVPLPVELAHLAPSGRGHRVTGVQKGDADALYRWMNDLAALEADSHSADRRGGWCSGSSASPANSIGPPRRASRACS